MQIEFGLFCKIGQDDIIVILTKNNRYLWSLRACLIPAIKVALSASLNTASR
jgi:hypothetical protein